MAFPTTPTRYYVTLVTAPGCTSSDSVFVNVKSFVSLDAGNDTTICLTDAAQLRPISDALHYSWSPASSLDDPISRYPSATPTDTTLYTVTARIGKCLAVDSLRIFTVPYPSITLSPDTTLCYGDTARLSASGGISYQWTPTKGLSSPNIPAPLASPLDTTLYRVAVRDNKGCPKPSYQSVRVNVRPRVRVSAGNDTVVVVGQPLKLTASGGDRYLWSPPAGLDDPSSATPTAMLRSDARYILKAIQGPGCFALDTVKIRVFLTTPNIFVPTAFTPNGDRLNDRLTPIPVGISDFEFFRIFNRWGQLVFSTQRIGEGWDGVFRGIPQGNETFSWQVRGRDYLGNTLFRKGTSTLIR